MPSQSFVPSITIPHSQTTGALSLHDYRRNLNQTPSPDEIGNLKKLKRKHGALNLNQTQPDIRAPGWAWDPVSASSAASSPPPLSPSYSMSAMSMLSSERDLGRELEGEGFETGTYSEFGWVKGWEREDDTNEYPGPELAAFQEKSTEYAVRARTGGSWRKMVRSLFQLSAYLEVTPADDKIGYISGEIRANTSNTWACWSGREQ